MVSSYEVNCYIKQPVYNLQGLLLLHTCHLICEHAFNDLACTVIATTNQTMVICLKPVDTITSEYL